jgi:hypothetical protein
LIRKAVVLIASVALIAVVMAPVSASADTFERCPKGTQDKHYCKKEKKCVVPELVGRTLHDAEILLRRHDCRLGDVKRQELSETNQKKDDQIEHGFEGGIVVKQSKKPKSIWPKGTRVDVVVEF